MKSILVKTVILCTFIYLGYYLTIGRNKALNTTLTYTTAKASIENLVSTVTGSGSVTASNSATITTSTSGVVKKLYAKNGDLVKTGQLIAEIELDLISRQKYAQASSTYQAAKNSLASAQANLYTQQATTFSANQKFLNDAVNRGLSKDDPTYIQQNATWLAA